MADTKLADLTALTAPSGDDLLYVVDDPAGTPADRKLALANLFTRGTVTASSPVIDAAQTWNNAAVTFTGIKANITDTASASGSLLMDLQVGGTSQFQIRKDGRIYAPELLIGNSTSYGGNPAAIFFSGPFILHYVSGAEVHRSTTAGIVVGQSYSLNWNSDLFLTRKAAASLRLGAADAASPVAQTLGVQSVVAGTTNTAGANFTIAGSQGTGSGAGGSIIFQVAPAGSSGTAQNALTTALTIGGDKVVTFNSGGSYVNTGGTYIAAAGSTGSAYANSGVYFKSSDLIRWSSTSEWGAADDLIIARDAAYTLALRNSTNAQTFRIYNTYTDASNYERGFIRWTSNEFHIGTESAGTGLARDFKLLSPTGTILISNTSLVLDSSRQIRWSTSPITYITPRSTAALDLNLGGLDAASPASSTIGAAGGRPGFDTNTAGGNFTIRGGLGTGSAIGGNVQFAISLPSSSGNSANLITNIAYFSGANGHFLWNTDNTYDIGASGATRPRDLFVGGGLTTGAPTGGTAAKWKLGTVATVSPTSPDRTIEVDIGGTIYYIHAKTTND